MLDDADLGTAVGSAVNGAFFSTGQRCTASSRLIVTQGIHDKFVGAMVERMQKELGGFAAPVATGGLAPLVLGRCSVPIRHEPLLTLRGLRIIYERNASH